MLLPSGRVTVCSTSQTMSLVSAAICWALSETPGRNWYCWAKVVPASIRALYWTSSGKLLSCAGVGDSDSAAGGDAEVVNIGYSMTSTA